MDGIEGRAAKAIGVTWFSVIVNCVLSLGKLLAGIWGHSSALVADAIHSLSDFVTDFAVLAGMGLAKRPRDADHPYGHGKFETLTAVVIGIVLAVVGVLIVGQACHTLYLAVQHDCLPTRPMLIAFWAGLVSVVVKEMLYQMTMKVARNTGNEALRANAWHHRSDAFSSIATSIGVGAGALLGGQWVLLDPIAACVVGLILVRIAWGIVADSVEHLVEHGMEPSENQRILELVLTVEGLSEVHGLRSRWVGCVAVIELHFRVDPDMTVRESHGIAECVEERLREAFGEESIITIHVEPRKGAI